MSINLGTNGTTHYYAVGDETRCGKCYGNTLVKIGTIHVNGVQQDTHRCTSCNIITSRVDGGIQSLINEAQQTMGQGANIGYTSAGGVSGAVLQAQLGISNGSGYASNGTLYGSGLSNQAGITFDYNTNNKFDSMNNSLTSISSTIYQLIHEMQKMSQVVKDLAQQNKDLMEKLATDPLNGMRKAVNSFNLE